MKLTKKATGELETTLRNLERAAAFIDSSDTLICRKKRMATTTLDFTDPAGTVITPICKEYGSDLTGLKNGIAFLQFFLKVHGHGSR